MLLELYEFTLDPRTLQVLFGLAIGLVFGVAAQITRFCLRRAVASDIGSDHSALAVWLMALGVAIAGFQVATSFGLVDVSQHRFLSSNLPFAAIAIGGLLFGAGMVLTRGCISRLTVLSASGNMRAMIVIAVFAIVAHATLKGVLAPLRVELGKVSIDQPIASLAQLPGAAPLVGASVLIAALLLARKTQTSWAMLGLAALIGLVPVAGWMTTSVLLFDEFDPLAVQSAAFTLPWSDTLFWAIASSAIPAGFGTGLIAGVLLGAFLSAAFRGELQLQGFEAPGQMPRYALGGAMMGVGGVLAGGCTVGAGLSGGAALSVAALLALASIILGAIAVRFALANGGKPKTA